MLVHYVLQMCLTIIMNLQTWTKVTYLRCNNSDARVIQVEPGRYLAVGDNVHMSDPRGELLQWPQRILQLLHTHQRQTLLTNTVAQYLLAFSYINALTSLSSCCQTSVPVSNWGCLLSRVKFFNCKKHKTTVIHNIDTALHSILIISSSVWLSQYTIHCTPQLH